MVRAAGRPSVGGRLAATLAGTVVVFAGVLGGGHGVVLAALASMVGEAARRGVSRARDRERDEQARVAAEDLLAAFADELDAGRPPDQALRNAVGGVLDDRRRATAQPAASAERTAALAAAIRLPVTLDEVPALLAAGGEASAVLRACQAPALRQLAVGWQVSHRSGIRLAPVASRLAAAVRADADRRRELRAALADARSSARLVASLPVAGTLLGALVGAGPHEVLFGTRPGLICLVAGVLLDMAGLGWTNRIAAAAVHRNAEPFPPSGQARLGAQRDRPHRDLGRRNQRGQRRRASRLSRGAWSAQSPQPSRSPQPAQSPWPTQSPQPAQSPWPARPATGAALAVGGAATVVATAVTSPQFAFPVGCAAVASVAAWLFAQLRRAARSDPTAQLLADLPVTLDLVAACLAAGTPPEVAQRIVGDVVGGVLGAALVAAARRSGAGAPAGEAFSELVAAGRSAAFAGFERSRAGPAGPAVVAVARAFERSGDSGARIATTLERVAERVRASTHVEAIEAVRRAGVRAVLPLGLCFLPAFALLGVVPVVLGTAGDLLREVSSVPGAR